ncbi:hypothetical protein PsYK624_105270 [Phanerochaete sordida]|uniref:Uncharacterized protein n=1 Tax=Phanerochaete sordida TaxID=48140 RepID=A0A9P3GG87_9APHY|nr:hypothetical protein PsYK624_105270 [Phanerochaete sordida]
MPDPLPSSKFATIFDSLPQDAQQTLIYQQLIPLLSSAPNHKAKKILKAASRLQKRHENIPDLDLAAKKAEINNMLTELNKDAKRSYVMDSSNRVELLNEIVDSLARWMSDIWVVVFEHRVDFKAAHGCLLFVSATLDRLENVRMGCKCALDSLYIPVTIRSRKGRIVKRFDINGATHLEDASLFIWRDMFLSILAYGSQSHKSLIPKMLGDIEEAIGWKALVRLMYQQAKGGKRRMQSDKESDWEDVDTDEDDLDLPALEDQSDSEASSFSTVDDGDSELDFDTPRLRHWSDIIYGHAHLLQRAIENALTAVFENIPSMALYSTLLSMAQDPRTLEERLLLSLKGMATSCPETFAVALEIYSLEHKVDEVVALLDSHSHLLRPRDAPSLQAATTLLSHHGHGQRALKILEAELLDTVRMTRRALVLSFSQLDTPQNRTEIALLLKMSSRAPGRRGRIEAWVDAVQTPGADQPNPMMFAALFMGMGPLPGMHSDDDPYTYLDLDPHDPDLEDLRSEHRPNLKKRFESWVDVAQMMKGGPQMLLLVYKKVIDDMPFLRASDVTEEMISRLQDRRSKTYVVDGLDALLAFVKVQRRKYNAMKAEKAAAAAKPAGSSSAPTPLPTYASPAGPSRPPGMPAASSSSSTLNILPRSDSPGPPPLIPVASLATNPPPPGPAPASSSQASAPAHPAAPPRADSPGPPPLIPVASLSAPQPPAPPPQQSTSQPFAPPPPQQFTLHTFAQPPLPTPGPLATDIFANPNVGAPPPPLVAEIDAILAAAPPAPPEGHTPLSLLNLLMGGGVGPPPEFGQGEQAGPAYGSSVDDVD